VDKKVEGDGVRMSGRVESNGLVLRPWSAE